MSEETILKPLGPWPGKMPQYVAPSDGVCLTKREIFAAMAMQGILSTDRVSGDGLPWDQSAALQAVDAADALIKALEAKGD